MQMLQRIVAVHQTQLSLHISPGLSASCCRRLPVIPLTLQRGCCGRATWLVVAVTAEAAAATMMTGVCCLQPAACWGGLDGSNMLPITQLPSRHDASGVRPSCALFVCHKRCCCGKLHQVISESFTQVFITLSCTPDLGCYSQLRWTH